VNRNIPAFDDRAWRVLARRWLRDYPDAEARVKAFIKNYTDTRRAGNK